MRSGVLIAQHREGDEGEAKEDQGGEESGLIGARLEEEWANKHWTHFTCPWAAFCPTCIKACAEACSEDHDVT